MAADVVDLRRLRARDLAPLLEAESRAWYAHLRWDFSPAARIVSACLDEQRLSGYALLDSGKACGYSFFFYEDDKGLIGDLFVEPGGDSLERARLLLTHTVETLLATPGLRRVETQLPHFAPEELAPDLRAWGFQVYPRLFMVLALDDRWADPLAPPSLIPAKKAARLAAEFHIEPWTRRHDLSAAVLVYHTYHRHVDARINDHYSSTAGATHLLENILRHRGCGDFIPAASRVAVHRATQKLVGVLALTRVREGTGHIPQVAIAPEFQGAGLGTELLRRSFDSLVRGGYREVSLTVTDENSGAVRLYERLGFETFRSFGAFVWERS